MKLNLLSSKNRDHIFQVGFVALNVKGEYGAYSVRKGFEYAVYNQKGNQLIQAQNYLDEDFTIEDL